MPISASTDLVPPADRQAFWTEAICRSFANVETRPLGAATVSGHFEFVEIGNAKLVRFELEPAVLQPQFPAGEPSGFGRLHVRLPDARPQLDDARRARRRDRARIWRALRRAPAVRGPARRAGSARRGLDRDRAGGGAAESRSGSRATVCDTDPACRNRLRARSRRWFDPALVAPAHATRSMSSRTSRRCCGWRRSGAHGLCRRDLFALIDIHLRRNIAAALSPVALAAQFGISQRTLHRISPTAARRLRGMCCAGASSACARCCHSRACPASRSPGSRWTAASPTRRTRRGHSGAHSPKRRGTTAPRIGANQACPSS